MATFECGEPPQRSAVDEQLLAAWRRIRSWFGRPHRDAVGSVEPAGAAGSTGRPAPPTRPVESSSAPKMPTALGGPAAIRSRGAGDDIVIDLRHGEAQIDHGDAPGESRRRSPDRRA